MYGPNCTMLWREIPLNGYATYFPLFAYPCISGCFICYFIWIYVKQPNSNGKLWRKQSYPDLAVVSTIMANICLTLFFVQEAIMVSSPQLDFAFIFYVLGVTFIVFVIFVTQAMIKDVAETFISMGKAKGKKITPIKRMLPSFILLITIYGVIGSLYYLNLFGPSIVMGVRVIFLGAIPVCSWIWYQSKTRGGKLVTELKASLQGNQNADILVMKENLIKRLEWYNKFLPILTSSSILTGGVCGLTKLFHHPLAWIIAIQVFLPMNCLMANVGIASFLYRKPPPVPKSSHKSTKVHVTTKG